MEEWTEIIRKPITIGHSRGFVIPKDDLNLKAGKEYVIRIIEKNSYFKE